MGQTFTVPVPDGGWHPDRPETTRIGRVPAEGIPEVLEFLREVR